MWIYVCLNFLRSFYCCVCVCVLYHILPFLPNFFLLFPSGCLLLALLIRYTCKRKRNKNWSRASTILLVYSIECNQMLFSFSTVIYVKQYNLMIKHDHFHSIDKSSIFPANQTFKKASLYQKRIENTPNYRIFQWSEAKRMHKKRTKQERKKIVEFSVCWSWLLL